jgi:2-methylaconitate cis-trans-isomerase PrpF
MTVGLCLGVAAHIPDTVAWRLAGGSQPDEVSDGTVRIQHPSGVVDVGAVVSVSSSGDIIARSAKVIRTGKRLMNGHVWT